MIVTAMLAWFNETPRELHRAVTSLQTIADRVIAVDGGWNLYPGAAASSPPEQAQAIQQAAESIGIEADIHTTGQVWAGQVDKRDYMLQHAAPTSDWVLPLDADWVLHGNRNQIRHELEHTEADALIVDFYTPTNPDAHLEDVAATDWHAQLAGNTMREPLIFRALEGIRVEDHHWFYSALKHGQRVALWGCHGRYPTAHTEPLQAPFRIDHMCLHRDQRTIQANRAYCQDRAEYVAANGREP